MRIYFDPSVLISFYVAEPASRAIRGFVQEQNVLSMKVRARSLALLGSNSSTSVKPRRYPFHTDFNPQERD